MSDKICPVCEAGHLHAKTKQYEEEYHGHIGQVNLFFSECDTCGSEVPSEDDLRAGRRALISFKKQVDGLLSGIEIRAFRKRYNITQAMANQLFGGGAVAFSRYESDELIQSEQMDQLLRLCIEDFANLRRIASRKGIRLPQPRIASIYETTAKLLHTAEITASRGQATHEQSWSTVACKLGVANLFNSGTASSKAVIPPKSSIYLDLHEAGTIQ